MNGGSESDSHHSSPTPTHHPANPVNSKNFKYPSREKNRSAIQPATRGPRRRAPTEAAARTNVTGSFGGAEVEAAALARGLNPSQAKAVAESTRRRMTLVHGPPGTGKTRTAVEVVRQWVLSGRTPVLVCADSNIAVDNLCASFLAQRGHQGMGGRGIIRVGRMDQVRPELHPMTIDMGNPRSSFDPQSAKKAIKTAEVVRDAPPPSCFSFHLGQARQ